MKSIPIATIEAVSNGWLVTTGNGGYQSETTLHTTWDSVERAVRDCAGRKKAGEGIEWRRP